MPRLRPSASIALALVTVASIAHAQSTPAPATAPAATLVPDPPANCNSCAEWNAPRQPFKVYGNTYFVGPAGVSAVLITSPQGHILIDGALQESVTMIDQNIRALGFKTTDIKLILTSHGHYDHVGGVHALQRYTGATVIASVDTARALALGAPVPEDPQAPRLPVDYFPKVERVRTVKDGETVRVGPVGVTAHAVPGHTPGATTWTWQSCEGQRCLNMVYADSLSTMSNEGFRFTGDATHPSLVDGLRASIRKVAALPCDIMMSTHPVASRMDDKLKARAAMKPGDADPFIEPGACKALAEGAMKGLDERVKQELATKK